MKLPSVTILLSTYNGGQFLDEQLESLCKQDHHEWQLYIRDDGSRDQTLSILDQAARRDSRIHWNEQETLNLGPTASFARLMNERSDDHYFLFCDQDDYWFPHKISRSLERMRQAEITWGTQAPLLIHTDLTLTDAQLQPYARSMKSFMGFRDDLSGTLQSLLAQNVVTGCTMLANRSLVKMALPIPSEALMHDAWLALIASALGKVEFIAEPTLFYRQHSLNASQGARRKSLNEALQQITQEPDSFEKLMRKRFSQSKALQERLERLAPDHESTRFLQGFHQSFQKNRINGICFSLSEGIWMQGILRSLAYYGLLLRSNPMSSSAGSKSEN